MTEGYGIPQTNYEMNNPNSTRIYRYSAKDNNVVLVGYGENRYYNGEYYEEKIIDYKGRQSTMIIRKGAIIPQGYKEVKWK